MAMESLNDWNLWWSTGKVPESLKGIKRESEAIIFKALYEPEIIILTGVRRAGKTTLMYQMIELLLEKNSAKQVLYLNFDDVSLKNEGFERIYAEYRQTINPDRKAFVFLDEIQNIKEWEKFVKKYYDLKENIKFIVSGSSAHLLGGEYSTLLTGRNFTFQIFPLSFREYLNFSRINLEKINTALKNKIINLLNDYLENGGFPEVFFKEKELKQILLKQYFDDILYKDVINRHELSAQKLKQLAVYALTNIANTFTIRKIRNFTGLSIDSIKEYFSYLEEAYLLIILEHFSYSGKDRHQAPKKVYCLDAGLRNASSFKFSNDTGRLAENLVCVELLRRKKEIFYWKSQKQHEVDFVIKNSNNSLTAINVCFSDNVPERETKSLQEFEESFKNVKELVVITRDTEKKEGKVVFIPLWNWLLTE